MYYFNAHRKPDFVLYLQKRYEHFEQNIIYKIFRDVFNEEVLSCKADGNFGTGHVIFFVETKNGKYVLRANVGLSEREYYMDLESSFIEMYEKANIPVGKVIYSGTTRMSDNNEKGIDYQIVEILPGNDLETEWKDKNGNDRVGNTKERYDGLSFQLGQIVARQYKAPVKGFGRFLDNKNLEGSMSNAYEYLIAYLDYDLEVISNAGIFTKEQVKNIKSFFAENKYILDEVEQAYLVHHDLADHNIRYEGDKIVAIFDWENAVAFDPICELGSAPTWVCHYPRKEKMIEGFLFEMKSLNLEIPKYFKEKIAIYFLRTMLWKIAFAIKGGKLKERHINLINRAFSDCGLDIKLGFNK